MKGLWRWMAVMATVITMGVVAGPVSAGASTSCAVTWGSLDKQATSNGTSNGVYLTNVRAGEHVCYDRLVLDIDGDGSARVRYVSTVFAEGSGDPIPLRGGAFLKIITSRTDNIDTGASTYNPANPAELVKVTGFQTLRQAAFGGSFEGQSTIGLGVRARLPFRVFSLSGPGTGSRLVIDIAHHW